MDTTPRVYQNVVELIGHTPLIRINQVAAHLKCQVYAKVEYFNPGNSIKDRIAVQMIEDAERSGKLKPGGTIVEGTSGNTGMGLALVAAVKGYRCIFTMPDKQSIEKINILRAVGAEVVVTPTNVAPEDPQSYYSVARRLAEEIPGAYYPNQYDNLSNREAHYRTTGPEIWAQTEGKITHLVAGMGTCGTIVGTARYLKEQNPYLQVVGADTYGSLFKKLHETGQVDMTEVYPYLTEGIGEDIIPANLDMSVVNEIVKVTDKDAALTARRLARLEGLFIGWSCGSAMWAALDYAERHNLTASDVLVVILPDHGTRYLGKVYNDHWMADRGFLESGAMLTAEEVIRRKADRAPVVTVAPTVTLGEVFQLMRQHNVSQVPVTEGGKVVGSVNESRLLNTLVDDPAQKGAEVRHAMNDPFPFVLPTTRIELVSKMITKENPAVLVQLPDRLEILTKYDLISALAGD